MPEKIALNMDQLDGSGPLSSYCTARQRAKLELHVINGPDYASYIKCMEEIKRRQRAIDDVLRGAISTSYDYTNIEFIALQYRKIFELIILATLASHQHLFEGLTRKLAKEWQVSKIVGIVRAKNPAFYPKPIDHGPPTVAGAVDDWLDVKEGFLTLEELIEAHGKIGRIMHANNPYQEELLLEELRAKFPIWRERLIRLLNSHLIQFPDDSTVMYVGMKNEKDQVHTNLFKKIG